MQTYRRVLSGEPDQSVTISSIGIHTNLAALLKSEPDEHSPLNGHDLVAQKVSLLAVMGGAYPSGTECNLRGGLWWSNQHNHIVASEASSFVAESWPGRIIWLGVGIGIQVVTGGPEFQKCKVATDSNPVKAAMLNFHKGVPNRGRWSWDPMTTLLAVRGAAAVGCAECTDCDGHNRIDPQRGNNSWLSGPKSKQSYLVLKDAKIAEEAIDGLLCQSPKALSPR